MKSNLPLMIHPTIRQAQIGWVKSHCHFARLQQSSAAPLSTDAQPFHLLWSPRLIVQPPEGCKFSVRSSSGICTQWVRGNLHHWSTFWGNERTCRRRRRRRVLSNQGCRQLSSKMVRRHSHLSLVSTLISFSRLASTELDASLWILLQIFGLLFFFF